MYVTLNLRYFFGLRALWHLARTFLKQLFFEKNKPL